MKCSCGGYLVLERIEAVIAQYKIGDDGRVHWSMLTTTFAQEIETNGLRCTKCGELYEYDFSPDKCYVDIKFC